MMMRIVLGILMLGTTAAADTSIKVERLREKSVEMTQILRYGLAFDDDSLRIMFFEKPVRCDTQADKVHGTVVLVDTKAASRVVEGPGQDGLIPRDHVKLSITERKDRVRGTVAFDYNDPDPQKQGGAHYRVRGTFEVQRCKK